EQGAVDQRHAKSTAAEDRQLHAPNLCHMLTRACATHRRPRGAGGLTGTAAVTGSSPRYGTRRAPSPASPAPWPATLAVHPRPAVAYPYALGPPRSAVTRPDPRQTITRPHLHRELPPKDLYRLFETIQRCTRGNSRGAPHPSAAHGRATHGRATREACG